MASSLIIFTLLVGNASALDVALYDTTYNTGETFQAWIEVLDSIRDLEAKDFVLYKYNESNLTRIRFTPFYFKVNSDYFVYFDLDGTGNYSFGVENIPLMVNNTEKSIRKDFFVSLGNKSLSIRPGYFKVGSLLELKVTNSYEDVVVNFIVPNFVSHPYVEEVVAGGRERVFRFNVDTSKVQSSFNITMKYDGGTYDIPVFLKESKEYGEALKFLTDLNVLNKIIKKDETLSGALRFQNLIGEPLYNLNFTLTGNLNKIVRLNFTRLSYLRAGGNGEQFVWINENKNAAGIYEGELILNSNQGKASMKMRFEVNEEKIIPRQELQTNDSIKLPVKQETEPTSSPAEQELFPFKQQINFTSQPSKVVRTSKGFIMFLLFILVIGILIFLLSRRGKEKKSFEDYVKEHERK
ncbi:hypothetical protein HYT58_00080 [Candidatus Woesearchaeota archaeon]|nr:hypothetical protein [Candidatus Woesearchaeota archaeon]